MRWEKEKQKNNIRLVSLQPANFNWIIPHLKEAHQKTQPKRKRFRKELFKAYRGLKQMNDLYHNTLTLK